MKIAVNNRLNWFRGAFGFLLMVLVSCNNTSGAQKIVKQFNELKDTSVIEEYHPERPVDFPHSVHSQLKQTSNCNYCHKNGMDEKVKLNICAECHDVNLSSGSGLGYYQQLDSISGLVKQMKSREK